MARRIPRREAKPLTAAASLPGAPRAGFAVLADCGSITGANVDRGRIPAAWDQANEEVERMPEIEHPTEELLLALFEEQLPAAEVEHLLAHLDSCEICEQRVSLIEPAFARYQRCRELIAPRSEEHTSELQSLRHLVCRLLL